MIETRRKIARKALHEEVADELRAMVIAGTLPPGARIGERELSLLLDVSRTPLRDALKLLATERLVEIRPNRGAIVAPLDRREISELFEALAGLERLGAELAAERMSRGDLERLEAHQKKIEIYNAAGDLLAYASANREYHLAIMSSSGNSILVESHAHLLQRAERARFMALGQSGRWSASIKEHREVLQELRRGDGLAAGCALRAHVLATGQVINDRLTQAEQESSQEKR